MLKGIPFEDIGAIEFCNYYYVVQLVAHHHADQQIRGFNPSITCCCQVTSTEAKYTNY